MSRHARISEAQYALMDASMRQMVERAPIGLLCLTLDGRIGLVNEAVLEWTGYTRSDLIEHKFQELIGAGAQLFFDTHHAPLLLMQGSVSDIAIDLRGKDGRLVPVLVHSVLLRDEASKPVMVHVSLFNASERRRHERELLQAKRQAEQAAQTLEQRVTERTSLLTDALAQAQAAGRAKTDFLANMSHEIRTPLNCILGMACLAMETPDERQRGYVENISQAGQQLLRIVGDILDFCKMEAGKLRIEHCLINPRDVITSTCTRFEGLAREKGLLLTIALDPEVPELVSGDAVRLAQVLSNYVSNAIKFTQRGTVDVHASVKSRKRDGWVLRIEVRDTGIGMSNAQQQNLFQPFYQADTSSTRSHGGTGLGLAICRQLAEMMDGAVGVTSKVGLGSLFWVEMRLALPSRAMPVEQPAVPPVPAAAAKPCSLAGANILLAEDNPLNQELARILVERSGARITIVANGEEALAALSKATFDCVLMDLHMPLMDGCECARRIRADAALVNLPIIALTANVFSSAREECKAAGMDDFLVKPIDSQQFYATLERWIGGRSNGGAVQACAVPQHRAVEPDETVSLSLLASLVDDDEETMGHLLQIFLDNARGTIIELQAAVPANQHARVKALAHRLKSSARAVGAMPLAEACERLEVPGTVEEMHALVGGMPGLLDRIQLQLAVPGSAGLAN